MDLELTGLVLELVERYLDTDSVSLFDALLILYVNRAFFSDFSARYVASDCSHLFASS